jgi:hypothetical protein
VGGVAHKDGGQRGAAPASSTWERSCAEWMQQLDLADVLRDDFLASRQSSIAPASAAATATAGAGDHLPSNDVSLGEAGSELDTAEVREATRAHMATTMEALIALLQKHRPSLRHVFLSYCRSWPFGIPARLLANCSSDGGLAGRPAGTSSTGVWEPGGMTLSEFWRLVQDLGMSPSVLSRDDSDLIFLRSNKTIYDRQAFYRAVVSDDDDGELGSGRAGGGASAAAATAISPESWVRRFQTLECSMSFPQFVEALVRLAQLHGPHAQRAWVTKPGGLASLQAAMSTETSMGTMGGSRSSTGTLRERVESFLSHHVYPAVIAEKAAPFDTSRLRAGNRGRRARSGDSSTTMGSNASASLEALQAQVSKP